MKLMKKDLEMTRECGKLARHGVPVPRINRGIFPRPLVKNYFVEVSKRPNLQYSNEMLACIFKSLLSV
jgi:hypothetical protein